MKILIVEENNNCRKFIEDLLTSYKYSIISTDDSELALNIFKTDKPDIIISEFQTSKISGLQG